jgi:hypothetical protein
LQIIAPLETAVMKCIEPEPGARFSSMGQFLSSIKRVKSEDAA